MSLPLEDYAVIGDTQTAALVGRDGSIDWLCLPRFDSPACFASLLGDASHGRWLIAPVEPVISSRRAYRGNSLVLETELTTVSGTVRLVDCMPPRDRTPDLVRLVEGVSGEVEMRMELIVRFDYGSIVPWVRRIDGLWRAIGGPDAVSLWSSVPVHGEDLTTRATFTVKAGEVADFLMVWHPSHEGVVRHTERAAAVEETCAWWEEWCQQCTYWHRCQRPLCVRHLQWYQHPWHLRHLEPIKHDLSCDHRCWHLTTVGCSLWPLCLCRQRQLQ